MILTQSQSPIDTTKADYCAVIMGCWFDWIDTFLVVTVTFWFTINPAEHRKEESAHSEVHKKKEWSIVISRLEIHPTTLSIQKLLTMKVLYSHTGIRMSHLNRQLDRLSSLYRRSHRYCRQNYTWGMTKAAPQAKQHAKWSMTLVMTNEKENIDHFRFLHRILDSQRMQKYFSPDRKNM